MTIYIQQQGAILQKSKDTLTLRYQGKLIYRMPLLGVDRIVIIGHVQVSTFALHAILEAGIDIAFMTHGGRLVGTLHSANSANVFLRMSQYERFHDMDFRIDFARNIAKAKIKSQIELIRYHKWEDSKSNKLSDANTLHGYLDTLDDRKTIEEIRGVEGASSKLYFECFGQMLNDLRFTTRSRRPAKDEPNALLNLGYTLLTNECIALLDAVGLDSMIGMMHGTAYGRASLALDIIEPFRCNMVDKLVVKLINWRIIQAKDFTNDPELGFRLTPDALRIFFMQYEKHVQGEDISYRERLRSEIDNVKKSIYNNSAYCPEAE